MLLTAIPWMFLELLVQNPHCLTSKTVYVGIDFGTSRSGYAFAYGADSTPQLQFNWPGESVQQAKTLTAILYDKRTWEALAWGMDAYVQ